MFGHSLFFLHITQTTVATWYPNLGKVFFLNISAQNFHFNFFIAHESQA